MEGALRSSAASEISTSSSASASLKQPSVTMSQSRIVAQEKFSPTNGVVLPAASGFIVRGLDFSPIRGPEGNIEYLAQLVSAQGGAENEAEFDIPALVKASHSSFREGSN